MHYKEFLGFYNLINEIEFKGRFKRNLTIGEFEYVNPRP